MLVEEWSINLARDVVHVVRLRLDEFVADAWLELDAEEQARAARFVFGRDRRRFVRSHALMRRIVGRAVTRPPLSLRFTNDTHGKPRLVDAGIDLRFNLSHAGERGLLAMTVGRELGVDIEEHRHVELMELANRFFATGERAALEKLGEPDRTDAFFRCWTRKEAFIKAVGQGLSYPLDKFEVKVADDESRILVACEHDPGALERWTIVGLSIDVGYSAAIAVEGDDWRLVQCDQAEALATPRPR